MESNEKIQIERQEYREKKQRQRLEFYAKQNLPYEVKVRRAAERVHEFVREMDKRGCNCHVSVGGLDSITLLMFIRSLGYKDIPAISVSNVEDKSIQIIHKQLGVEVVKSYKTKVQVLNEVGFPVISKRIAGKIDTLQHPTEKNKTVRHAIITGECGAQGHYATNSKMNYLRNGWNCLAGMRMKMRVCIIKYLISWYQTDAAITSKKSRVMIGRKSIIAMRSLE